MTNKIINIKEISDFEKEIAATETITDLSFVREMIQTLDDQYHIWDEPHLKLSTDPSIGNDQRRIKKATSLSKLLTAKKFEGRLVKKLSELQDSHNLHQLEVHMQDSDQLIEALAYRKVQKISQRANLQEIEDKVREVFDLQSNILENPFSLTMKVPITEEETTALLEAFGT